MILEGDQPRVVVVRTTEIELSPPAAFGILDRSPHQREHAPIPVVGGVGTPVLVNSRAPVIDHKDGGNRSLLMASEVNRRDLAKAFEQVAKPAERLNRHAMSTTSPRMKLVEQSQQIIGPAALAGDAEPFGSPDGSLRVALVKRRKNLIE